MIFPDRGLKSVTSWSLPMRLICTWRWKRFLASSEQEPNAITRDRSIVLKKRLELKWVISKVECQIQKQKNDRIEDASVEKDDKQCGSYSFWDKDSVFSQHLFDLLLCDQIQICVLPDQYYSFGAVQSLVVMVFAQRCIGWCLLHPGDACPRVDLEWRYQWGLANRSHWSHQRESALVQIG